MQRRRTRTEAEEEEERSGLSSAPSSTSPNHLFSYAFLPTRTPFTKGPAGLGRVILGNPQLRASVERRHSSWSLLLV
jgi:hypothetical protein